MTIKVGSLFDGSGGFPLAGAMCGFEPVWAAEVEPYPIAVTKSRFPNMKHLGSVTEVKGSEIEPVDIITFGSPCQDLSVAGKRAGLKHEDNGDDETTRSGLFMEAIRIIKEMREATNELYPRWAIWENVPGAFSSNKGEDFRIVCEELIKIVEPNAVMPAVPKNGWPYADCYYGDGWSYAYRTVDAQHFGVPQRRRRIYAVLDLASERAGEILFERQGLRGYYQTGRTPWQGIAGDAENCIGAADREGAVGLAPVASTLRAGAGAPKHEQDFLGRLVLEPVPDLLLDDQGGSQINVRTDGKSPTLRAEMHGNVQCVMDAKVYESHPMDSRIKELDDDVSPTVSVKWHKGAADTPLLCTKEQYLFENHSQDTRYKGPLDVCPMLPAQLGTGGNNTPFVVEKDSAIPIHDQATRFLGKRGSKSDGKGNGLGVGEPGDPMNTLTSGDRHAVAYSMKVIARNGVPLVEQANPICASDYKDPDIVAYCMETFHCTSEEEKVPTLKARDWKDPNVVAFAVDCRNLTEQPELYQTLQEKPNGGQSLNFSGAVRVRYIVRRLTPTECARLQGFPDWWGHPDVKEDFTDSEYKFWLNVRNTHAAINDKAQKEYTKSQMLTWYNKLHTDSSEYKMWGNGIALPCALYVMQGIQDTLA